eukprot:scaffold103700_cov42-Phaeocystis_antarctica.AAC.1
MAPGVKSFILDAEAVAYDRVKKTIMPFQVLTLTLTPTPTLAIMPFQVLTRTLTLTIMPLQVLTLTLSLTLTLTLTPFQVLSTRKRKDADVDDLKVQVCVFAFDMLYLNGEH